MAQSNNDSAYCSLDVFWHGPTQKPPVFREDWIQKFQLVVKAEEDIDIEDLLPDISLPEKPIKNQDGTEWEARNNTAITTWRDEDRLRAEYERRMFKGSTSDEPDKRQTIENKIISTTRETGTEIF